MSNYFIKTISKMLAVVAVLGGFGIVAALAYLMPSRTIEHDSPLREGMFEIQALDTMKYSRDTAAEMLANPAFDAVIDRNAKAAAGLGATHLSIGTPYDARFLPFLARWVAAARREGLKVWFRGNFSGWEGWFGYGKISRDEHKKLLDRFIRSNPDLFEDGDIFTPCPECENGGPGDPRLNGDLQGHRKFLIEEYNISTAAFSYLGKNVESGYFSMNGDVARLTMDKDTTRSLGGVVVIDHYVSDAEDMAGYIESLESDSGAKIVLGEFGAPIPDLNGVMTEREQADFIEKLMKAFYEQHSRIKGMNYWVFDGGSTTLVNPDGSLRLAYHTLARYYRPPYILGIVTDTQGLSLPGAKITVEGTDYHEYADQWGNYQVFTPFPSVRRLIVSASGFATTTTTISADMGSTTRQATALEALQPDLVYKIRSALYMLRQKWGI